VWIVGDVADPTLSPMTKLHPLLDPPADQRARIAARVLQGLLPRVPVPDAFMPQRCAARGVHSEPDYPQVPQLVELHRGQRGGRAVGGEEQVFHGVPLALGEQVFIEG